MLRDISDTSRIATPLTADVHDTQNFYAAWYVCMRSSCYYRATITNKFQASCGQQRVTQASYQNIKILD